MEENHKIIKYVYIYNEEQEKGRRQEEESMGNDIVIATRSRKQTYSEGQCRLVECSLLHWRAQGRVSS